MTSERYPQNRSGAPRRRPAPRPAAARPAAQGRGHRPAPAVARRSAKGPARPPRRRARGWRGIPAKLRLALCALAVAAVAFGIVRLVNAAKEASIERFVDNVYVNGVCLTGFTYEEGSQVLEQVRSQRLNTTYKLTFGASSYDFTPSAFGAQLEYDSELERAWNLGHVGDSATRRQIVKNLKEVPAEFNSTLTYDEAALDEFIARLADDLRIEPVDAEVAVTEEKPVIITASQNGQALNVEKTKENLVSLIETGQGSTALPVEVLQPTVTSDNMEMKVVAKFSTDVTFRGASSRSNVRQALSYFNGYVVYPGDTCDFNEVVGPRTLGRGFKEAPEYAGNEKVKGVGGGVCQASTTLYDAAIMANMTILERHNHNMTVSYVEPSQDAAVEYGTNGKDGKNFVFRNDTEHAIYIYTNVDKEWATVTIYGTRPEYHYELTSVIVEEHKSDRKRYEYDYDGKEVYYITDPPKLKTEGHGSCRSEGWIVAYDWDTKQEVSREQISYDAYVAGMNVYWRGVHDAKGNVVDPNAPSDDD